MLKNTLLIAKREYLERVRSKVFRITTVLVPVGVGALAALGGMSGRRLEGVKNVAIVSSDPVLAGEVRRSLEAEEFAPKRVEVVAPVTDADRDRLNAEVAGHQIDGYLMVESRGVDGNPVARWVAATSVNFLSKAEMEGAVSSALVREELLKRGMSSEQVQGLMQSVKLETEQVKNGQAVSSDTNKSFMGAYALILVLYGTVLIYGINVARSVVEEKTSRIFEVLLSTATADELMLGKLLGVGAAGLTQIGIWAVLVAAFAGSAMAASAGIHGLGSLGITGPELGYFAVFFILGYFFYSGLAAALGSTVNAEGEIQQFSLILVSPLVASVVLMPYVLANPSSVGAVVLSLIPPFTPIILYMRICSQMPPLWQVALGIALLTAAVWGMVWLAARIYRVGVLMYGKRATLPEMLRWLRYS